ncbi:MAG: SDR family oxidoreductase [Deltaproteobacteria bacterium]|nr:SDR family oxidoreductase [Deltaproteobacteria bacterium]
MIGNILITGATGNTAKPLIENLYEKGYRVRALVHSPSKRGMIERTGVEVVTGDYNDQASLEKALQGIERVYLVSPTTENTVAMMKNFVDTAKKKGVKRIVKLSAFGVSPESPINILRWHAGIEECIREADIICTCLHPHFFMENLLMNAESVKNEGAIHSPLGDTGIGMISVRDIAEIAARALTEEGHAGSTYRLTGPEAITFREIAETLTEVTGRKVNYVKVSKVSFEAAKENMMKMGMPGWFADDIVSLMKSWTRTKTGAVTDDYKKETNRIPTSFMEFCRRNRSAFV